jgi:hypothetical protein
MHAQQKLKPGHELNTFFDTHPHVHADRNNSKYPMLWQQMNKTHRHWTGLKGLYLIHDNDSLNKCDARTFFIVKVK